MIILGLSQLVCNLDQFIRSAKVSNNFLLLSVTCFSVTYACANFSTYTDLTFVLCIFSLPIMCVGVYYLILL